MAAKDHEIRDKECSQLSYLGGFLQLQAHLEKFGRAYERAFYGTVSGYVFFSVAEEEIHFVFKHRSDGFFHERVPRDFAFSADVYKAVADLLQVKEERQQKKRRREAKDTIGRILREFPDILE